MRLKGLMRMIDDSSIVCSGSEGGMPCLYVWKLRMCLVLNSILTAPVCVVSVSCVCVLCWCCVVIEPVAG